MESSGLSIIENGAFYVERGGRKGNGEELWTYVCEIRYDVPSIYPE